MRARDSPAPLIWTLIAFHPCIAEGARETIMNSPGVESEKVMRINTLGGCT
jgi:hypothetical protein